MEGDSKEDVRHHRQDSGKKCFGLGPPFATAEGQLLQNMLGPGGRPGPSAGVTSLSREQRGREPRDGVHLGQGRQRRAGGGEKLGGPPSLALSRSPPEQKERLSLMGRKH